MHSMVNGRFPDSSVHMNASEEEEKEDWVKRPLEKNSLSNEERNPESVNIDMKGRTVE